MYQLLSSAVQEAGETPQDFLVHLLDLKQKVLFASQEAESDLKYDPKLVQCMFLYSLLTGLQNDIQEGIEQQSRASPHLQHNLVE